MNKRGVAYRNTAGRYTDRYNMSDHPPVVGQVLGNVRAMLYRNPENNEVNVLQPDDHYTFGKQHIVAARLK